MFVLDHGRPKIPAKAPALAVAMVAAAALLLAGCGGGSQGSGSAPSPSRSLAVVPSSTFAPSAAKSASEHGAEPLLRAGKTALGQVPGGTVISIDSEHNGTAWQVVVATPDGAEHEIVTSGDGSKVVSGPSVKHVSDAEKATNQDRVAAAKLDYRAAADKALSSVPNSKITELNLGSQHGKTVWEADLFTNESSRVRHRLVIDAGSGKLLSTSTG